MARAATIPFPLMAMTSGTFGLPMDTVRLPITYPVTLGVKARLRCVVAPAVSLSGRVSPLV